MMVRLLFFHLGAVILLGMACIFQTNVELVVVLAIAHMCSTPKGCVNPVVHDLLLL